ncbi:MAG: hypothetical protein AAF998_26870 [Bacteroidota bacterium]
MVSLFPLRAFPQVSADSLFARPAFVIDHVPEGTTDIEVDQEGNVYLLQPDRHKLHKYFMDTGYDSVLTVGGKGIGREGFNFPTQISVPNRQSAFMLDYMNRRIVLLNTNLKVSSEINFLSVELGTLDEEVDFLWPISFAAGPTGELYVLNQEDIRIYKLINDGEVERTFGGTDYGTGSLVDPWQLTINAQNLVFAVDSTEQKVSIFDLFGTYQYSLQPRLKFRWKRLVTFGDNLLFLGEHKIFLYNLFSKRGQTVGFATKGRIVDAHAGRQYIYVLYEDRIHLYRLGVK